MVKMAKWRRGREGLLQRSAAATLGAASEMYLPGLALGDGIVCGGLAGCTAGAKGDGEQGGVVLGGQGGAAHGPQRGGKGGCVWMNEAGRQRGPGHDGRTGHRATAGAWGRRGATTEAGAGEQACGSVEKIRTGEWERE